MLIFTRMSTVELTDRNFVCDIQAPCFHSLIDEEVALIQASKTQVHFRKGDTLTKQGAFTSYLLFMIDGLAKQYLEADTSKNYNLRIVQPGEFVGLSAVFHKNTFKYSCTALTECHAYLIENEAIINLVKTNALFGYSITKRYCEQNSDLMDTLQTVLYKQMNGRLAETLLYLEGLKTTFPAIFQLLSRKDIAEFAGMSTESTVKLLKAFEKDKLLNLNEKDIQIRNFPSLQEISKKG